MRATAMRTDIREAIPDAVDRRLARFGYKKMTVDGLAEEAGIGKGTVYLHFPSRIRALRYLWIPAVQLRETVSGALLLDLCDVVLTRKRCPSLVTA